VFETVMTLVAVTGLAILVLLVARRSGLGRVSGPLALAGRLVLDARRAVYLVRVGETYYVVGASEAGLTKLGELTREALGEQPLGVESALAPRAFKEFLERLGPRRPPDPPVSGDAGE
jgi:flagellar biogenesis protein FliO